jgi:hypothetical protein
MKPDLEQIAGWFDTFNRDYFGGGLPRPRFALSRSRTRLGAMSCKKQLRGGRLQCTDYTIRLTTYYDQTERQLQTVLLHEMIHLSIAHTGLRDTAPHGVIFRGMMDALNRKYGWQLSVSTPMKGVPRTAATARNKTYLVLALETADSKCYLSVVNPRWARTLHSRLPRVSAIRKYAWFHSRNDFFSNFPAVRSLRGREVSRAFLMQMLPQMQAADTSAW